MNPNVTSQNEILAKARLIAQQEGIGAVNMRSVAASCGVALGSLYNYFPSKDDLLLAVIASIWQDIFHSEQPPFKKNSFRSLVNWFDACLKNGIALYPGFFNLHSLSFGSGDKEKGREKRDEVFAHMQAMMKTTLLADPSVKKDSLINLDVDSFINLVFLSVIYSRIEGKENAPALLLMIERTLY